jgi:hypothetical protein
MGYCGTQTAALAFGGQPLTGATEEYDGSTWTSSPGSLNTTRYGLAGAGIQTAALAFGGISPGPTVTGVTEEYNGATWTSSPASLSTTRYELAGTGTQLAALAFGGNSGSITAATEEWTGAGVPHNSYNNSFLTFTLSF